MAAAAGMAVAAAACLHSRRRGAKVQTVYGWVTLIKDGTELVAERPRLNAGEQRKHMELWRRRERDSVPRGAGARQEGEQEEQRRAR